MRRYIKHSRQCNWPHFQTPWSSSKILCYSSYFQPSSQCLEMRSNTVFCVKYITWNMLRLCHIKTRFLSIYWECSLLGEMKSPGTKVKTNREWTCVGTGVRTCVTTIPEPIHCTLHYLRLSHLFYVCLVYAIGHLLKVTTWIKFNCI